MIVHARQAKRRCNALPKPVAENATAQTTPAVQRLYGAVDVCEDEDSCNMISYHYCLLLPR